MTTPMNEQELDVFKDRLAKLAEHGTEASVRAYVDEQFPRLPKDMQDDIVMGLFVSGLNEEVVEANAVLKHTEDSGNTQQ